MLLQVAIGQPGHRPRQSRVHDAVRARLQDQHVSGGGERGVDRDRLGQRGVQQAPVSELDRGAGQPRQASGSPQRAADLLDAAQLGEVDDLGQVGVGGRAVQLDWAGQDRLEAQRPLVGPDVGDHVVHVEHRASAQGAAEAHEPRVAEPVVVERGQVGGLPGQQEGAVERARRRAVDLIEGIAQAQLLDRRGHAGRDHAPHPAALDHQRHPPAVAALAGSRALLPPAPDQLDHRVRAQVLVHRDGGAQVVGGESSGDHRH